MFSDILCCLSKVDRVQKKFVVFNWVAKDLKLRIQFCSFFLGTDLSNKKETTNVSASILIFKSLSSM